MLGLEFKRLPARRGKLLGRLNIARNGDSLFDEEQPLRAELFSVEQLEQHAKALAGWHQVDERPGRNRLLGRLAENEAVLLRAYDLVGSAVKLNHPIAPAAEWLLDNFYLVEEQIRTARQHFPKGYSRELPRLVGGPAAGLPRVYDIALELIAHVDGRIDAGSLSSFVGAYQTVSLLKLGELWAIPIMLRLALIENLRRVAARIAASRLDQDRATHWADRLLDVMEREPQNIVLVLADMIRARPPLTTAFVAEFSRRLQSQTRRPGGVPGVDVASGGGLLFPAMWLEQRLVEQGQTMEGSIQQESQHQAADQVSVGNSINSLRFLSAMDWREFVETMSTIEHVLRGDPADEYNKMDFTTRDRYRHVVERLARRTALAEDAVARAAVELARKAQRKVERLKRREAEGSDANIRLVDVSRRTTHVGYYLIDKGRPALEKAISLRISPRILLQRFARSLPLPLYLGGITAVTVAVVGLVLWGVWSSAFTHGGARQGAVALLVLPLLIGASQLAVGVVNWLSTLLVRPRPLPGMNFSGGIPPECRTMVVVPTMLTSMEGVDNLVEGLEVRFLANRDDNLHFALLTDFCDAPSETMPEDEQLLARAREGIEALNAKYPASRSTSDIFFLFHRPRRWNAQEDAWMGWERKRGKLAQFNALLRMGCGSAFSKGAENAGFHFRDAESLCHEAGFSLIVGRTEILPSVEYVITLDTDTQLPREAAHQLVSMIHHPLNRPVLSEPITPGGGEILRGESASGPASPLRGRRLIDGYAILQPRVGVSLPSAGRSWFARLFAGDAGIDPYTQAVSDVYQDVFGEGSFIGKGIYSVDAFEQILADRFPENRILSHDLLEGCHARSGLVSDVLLYEDYPSSYTADVKRRHRWIRGDWQIAAWILPRVPSAGPGSSSSQLSAGPADLRTEDSEPRTSQYSARVPNPLSALSRWKIFDNLRRSLVPPALALLLVFGWLLPGIPWLASILLTLVVAGIVVVPPGLTVAADLLRRQADLPLSLHLRHWLGSAGRQILQALFSLILLPYEAYMSLDAVFRTGWRVLVTNKRLLEWQTASDVERSARNNLSSFYRTMWILPVLAAVIALILYLGRPWHLVVAGPLLALWLAGPGMAWWLSRPLRPPAPRLGFEQYQLLRRLSRRTWRFFETFMGPADNWLPPDNYQEHPVEAIAHRTSPTNIGLSLLANLAAYDFGYISSGQLLDRTGRTLATMEKLLRYRGHFYNWYDTRTLETLPPLYISTVDSGNLAGHLLTLAPGLAELKNQPILPARTFSGLLDTLDVLLTGGKGIEKPQLGMKQDTSSADSQSPILNPHLSEILHRLARWRGELQHPPPTLSASWMLLQRVKMAVADAAAATASMNHSHEAQELKWWIGALEQQCRDAIDDLLHLAPWVQLPPPTEPLWRRGSSAQLHRLADLRQLLSANGGLDSIPTLGELAEAVTVLLPKIDAILDDLGRQTTQQQSEMEEDSASSDAARFSDHGSELSVAAEPPQHGGQREDAPAPRPAEGSELGTMNITQSQISEIGAEADWFTRLRRAITSGSQRAERRLLLIEQLSDRCRGMADLNYEFLYDPSRHLMSIGYNVTDHRLDSGYYDLLASEARLGSFIAIAQGKLPQEHWFSLGRLLTESKGEPALLSWSGSMFEYLMPILIMPNYESTLLDQTCRAVVRRHIQYGRQRGVPWGISESGCNTTDVHLIYQYRAFGVPGLGLKRGLADDLVVAPYATLLALTVDARASCRNLMALLREGLLGRYGFYEAIDYTPARLPRGQNSSIVRSFMAHHQGMSLLALASVLLNQPMQRRFQSDPVFKATDLLLQERIPRATPVFPHTAEVSADMRRDRAAEEVGGLWRVYRSPHTPSPAIHLLSNSRYYVAISAAGGGFSRWKAAPSTGELAVTRWREDPTRDATGTFCYLRDLDTGQFWSAAYQPTLKQPVTYEAIFSQARAEFRRRDEDLDTHTEISVSPEDDIELRRITITNRSRRQRMIELTSYAEVVLAPPAADAVHPAFSNLFVQTQIMRERQALLVTRRPRSSQERPPWMLHLMTVNGQAIGEASFETDRRKFLGRGRTVANPAAMDENPDLRTEKRRGSGSSPSSLSNTEGSVLDPIVAIRRTVTIDPDAVISIDIVSGMADTREAAVGLIEKYHDRRLADRVFELAWTHSHIILRQLDATEADAQLFGRIASSILYANPARRAAPSVIARNRRRQSSLWGYGISGDEPIVLLRIEDRQHIQLVRQLVQAHSYWRLKGLSVDLLIWNEDQSGYRQNLQDEIMGLISSGTEAHFVDRPGGIFVRRTEQIPEEDKTLMQAAARIIITDGAGTLAEQMERRGLREPLPPDLVPTRRPREKIPAETGARSLTSPGDARGRRDPRGTSASPARAGKMSAEGEIRRGEAGQLKTDQHEPRTDLSFYNGLGGFTHDGREYIIHTGPGQKTPAPWVNVIANPRLGAVVNENGAGYTWFENASQFRLTPWYNDPVSGAGGEAFYIRDEETGLFWSPAPAPATGTSHYTTRHGFGYTVFEHSEDGIFSEMWTYVATDAPVRFCLFKVRNKSGRQRRLSLTTFLEWVLGEHRNRTLMHVVTGIDPRTGTLLAHNAYHNEFADRVVFLDVSEAQRTVTGDRNEFLGRNGTPARPSAMGRVKLSGRVGAGLDPCGAMQTIFDLADGQEREVAFIWGAGSDSAEVRNLIQRFRGTTQARNALEGVWGYWNRTLGAVYVETPDKAVNFLVNGWLLYQVQSCRFWARSGFYQSSGAFGFRDQLQDACALIHNEPRLLREQLLRCAERQFREGDVQHWWHPPEGRGVRTRISDDYLWLPYAVARYVRQLGDTGVLEERIHFLEGRRLNPDEESYYDLPARSEQSATLYEHCVRAIKYGLRFGEHGLPLMGSGDWNDGMNLVGIHGRGESVWLGFFLYEVLLSFSGIARTRGDTAFAEELSEQANRLRENIEKHAWDGQWYRRAWFDNGEPLGSASNPECQIDALPQSWAILSRAGDAERTRVAIDWVDRRLVRRELKLIQLFDPPFDVSHLDPGYIKGYVPGVRENGGQYTHAAVWTVMAFAELARQRGSGGDQESGRGGDWDATAERAWELLSLINPIRHGATADDIQQYRVEPYVVAADVYTNPQHAGMGGWTWYTGSAGWMYRLITESLLGIRLEVNRLRLDPLIPDAWDNLKIHYRYRETFHHITIHNHRARKVTRVVLDGVEQPDKTIPLVDDRREHIIEVELGPE